MQPESFRTFHQALRFGPDFCPPDLFDGNVPAIVRGLKAHANNVAYARHSALEETYPRLARCLGPKAFHLAADRFLELECVLARSLDLLGGGFEQILACPNERDLARAEWAWFQAFQAKDAEALTLSDLARMSADDLIRARLSIHPATHCLALEAAQNFGWDHSLPGEGNFLLVTRPHAEVLMKRTDGLHAEIVHQLASDTPLPSLITTEPATFISLVEAGAIRLEDRP